MGHVFLWEMSVYGMCLLMGGVLLWKVFTDRRCLLMVGVPFCQCLPPMEGASYERCNIHFMRCLLMVHVGAPSRDLSAYGRCLVFGGICLWDESLRGGVHIWGLSDRGWPLIGFCLYFISNVLVHTQNIMYIVTYSV